MADYVKIDGADYWLGLSEFTLEQFKQDGANSYCQGLSANEVKALHAQIKEAAKANGYGNGKTDAG